LETVIIWRDYTTGLNVVNGLDGGSGTAPDADL